LFYNSKSQPITQYYKHLDIRTFLFELNDKSNNNYHLHKQYTRIFDFIKNNNLFLNVPNLNDIEIHSTLRLWYSNC
jgi:hypothetical protein